jgi:hypothetical protein
VAAVDEPQLARRRPHLCADLLQQSRRRLGQRADFGRIAVTAL